MIYLIGEVCIKDHKPFTWTMGATKKSDILECLLEAQIKCIRKSVPRDLTYYCYSKSLGDIKFTSMSMFEFDSTELTDIIGFAEIVLKKTESLGLKTDVYLDAFNTSMIRDALNGVVPSKLVW